MKPEKIWEHLTTEIINEFLLPRSTCHQFIYNRIMRAYGTGYDAGCTRGAAKKKVIQMTKEGKVLKEWESMAQVERSLRINNASISKCCTGKLLTSGGFRWKYA